MSDTKAVFLSIILTPNDDGYLASVPGIQGAFAEGNTIEEAIFNCIDVVKMIVAYRTERGENIRIISCRKATRSEQKVYEEGI